VSQSTHSPVDPDPPVPYPPHQLVGDDIAGEITGLSPYQLKRARQDGLLRFYRHRGRVNLYAVADLVTYRDAMLVAVEPKPKVTRTRSAEHNARIAEGVRRARAKATNR